MFDYSSLILNRNHNLIRERDHRQHYDVAQVLAWRNWCEQFAVSEKAQTKLHEMVKNGFSLDQICTSPFLNKVVEEGINCFSTS